MPIVARLLASAAQGDSGAAVSAPRIAASASNLRQVSAPSRFMA